MSALTLLIFNVAYKSGRIPPRGSRGEPWHEEGNKDFTYPCDAHEDEKPLQYYSATKEHFPSSPRGTIPRIEASISLTKGIRFC